MARWAPARTDVIGEIADEILHNYRRGRAVVGVDAEPGSARAVFADDLAAAIRDRGATAYRASADAAADPGGEQLRRTAVEPFRRTEGEFEEEGSAILVIDGTRLHGPQLLPIFAYTVWLTGGAEEPADTEQAAYERSVAPRVRATANVDDSDPEHPRRTFADSC